MTKKREPAVEAEQLSDANPGTDQEPGGGVTPSAGAGSADETAPTTLPPPDSNNPNRPAAATAIAPRNDPHPSASARKPFVSDLERDEERRDEAEKRERRRKKEPEPLNDAVGSSIVMFGGGRSTWTLKDGSEFAVTRFYPTKKVAVDFPADEAEVAMCEEKRAKLHEHGVAYVVIMPGKNMTIAQIEEAVQRDRVVLAEGR